MNRVDLMLSPIELRCETKELFFFVGDLLADTFEFGAHDSRRLNFPQMIAFRFRDRLPEPFDGRLG